MMNLHAKTDDEIVKKLSMMDIPELWDHLLSLQIRLNIARETNFIQSIEGWKEADHILEIGSGNGAYLFELSKAFPDKKFVGLEPDPHFLEMTRKRYREISFLQGNAEVFEQTLVEKFDLVFFRLVLQHLKQPYKALELTSHYLKQGGKVVIIDANDATRICHPPSSIVDEALRQLSLEKQRTKTGSRTISLDIVQDLIKHKEPLASFFDLCYSSIDEKGVVAEPEKTPPYRSKHEKEIYFNQMIFFLTLLQRNWHLPIDMKKAYQELQAFLDHQEAYFSPGFHWVVLKKR